MKIETTNDIALRHLPYLGVTFIFFTGVDFLDYLKWFKKLKAGPLGTAALQGLGDRGREEGAPPRRRAYAPYSPNV